MTTLTHNPLASPPAPRGADTMEPVRMSWLEMARVNFPGNPIARPSILFSCPFLQRAVEHGQALAVKLDFFPNEHADRIVGDPQNARRLRLYLAAVEGELDDAADLESAEVTLGVRNLDGTLREEWK